MANSSLSQRTNACVACRPVCTTPRRRQAVMVTVKVGWYKVAAKEDRGQGPSAVVCGAATPPACPPCTVCLPYIRTAQYSTRRKSAPHNKRSWCHTPGPMHGVGVVCPSRLRISNCKHPHANKGAGGRPVLPAPPSPPLRPILRPDHHDMYEIQVSRTSRRLVSTPQLPQADS